MVLQLRLAREVVQAEDSAFASGTLRSTADYWGARVEQGLHRRLRARLDTRLLSEGVTGTSRWSSAPSLTLIPAGGLELEAGYRIGDLTDPDFARNCGSGLFAQMGLRFTEGTVQNVADFWRTRIGVDQ